MKREEPHKITQNFIKDIKHRKRRIADFLGYKIIINKKVFPVDSPFSFSSKITAKHIPKNVKSMLDVGTGTGVQSIIAAKRGAKEIIAIDIDSRSLKNAKKNIKFHKLKDIIKVKKSDLLNNINKNKKFDLIISQLPFADVNYKSHIGTFLFDPGFKLHERLLKDAKIHLTKNGQIYIPSGDVANEKRLNELIKKYNYNISKIYKETFQNLNWKLYVLKL